MNEKTLKMNILGGMHAYMTHHINDEEIIDTWLALGVPDQPDEDDLEWCAENDFNYICHLFSELVARDR